MATATEPDARVLQVCAIAADIAGVAPAEVTPDSHLVNDLNFDSLDQVEFAMKLEEAFEISVPDEQAAAVRTVRDAVDLLALSETHSAPPAG